ncbi:MULTISPECIES: cyclopropane-fatty-acyl-phospholipid synthase family protein [unclassified Beijerinckia]|uniref:SAM-dependent methyltransferase n=1 Tax=unclassified Beijerinckia TaxID=2638183 RepID=UPI00089A3B01|nr:MULTISPECIES: cyclopropane-fatty-acyl-phospholipid synthase family protein [unclassified Beijerinckia]MDH7795368.1 cyclopropane-fatty-acyl-phospholipid synthase [Beijerinckia sp. GAS462]SEB98595.1 cyclopropane-fatty-acyl-phospholipid synthase [Beijerinckia sp. 28-YEA-48]
MTFVDSAIVAAEAIPVPDFISRAGINFLVARTRRQLANIDAMDDARFVAQMGVAPIAVHTDAANAQHYEVPAAFFALVLGPHRKYSCCLYPNCPATLEEAENAALVETVRNADLRNGQDILELGCGWGSLSLYMAEQFPGARITAVSNSNSQRAYIMGEAEQRGLSNLAVITCDMNIFKTATTFDRIVSVEMFEHMSNWRKLLTHVRGWLRPQGKLFLHVFTHRLGSYKFDENDRGDWIAQHFFTGGIMPSHTLIRQFDDLFQVETEQRWNGTHYRRTAEDWLANFDAHTTEIEKVLRPVYGKQTHLWMRRWRLFFLATSGLFGHADGKEWGVSHYLLRPAKPAA